MTKNCFCRICWNEDGWQHPSGIAPELETQSYVKINGFGHEEWLLNFGWMIGDDKFGFVQGFSTSQLQRQPRILNVTLFSIAPSKKRYIVGKIQNCQILSEHEANNAIRIYEEKGWLNEMADDVKRVKGNYELFTRKRRAFFILNVKFKRDDFKPYDPFIEIPNNHPLKGYHRYKPRYIEASDSNWSLFTDTKRAFKVTKLKHEEMRDRSAQTGTKVDPFHNRMQNSLFEHLNDAFGKGNVGYENQFVDLVVRTKNQTVYYEIKTESTAKKCVRLAIGQLLEYAHFPNEHRAEKLIVVGESLPTTEDIQYLEHLRTTYNLPIYYQRYQSFNYALSQEY